MTTAEAHVVDDAAAAGERSVPGAAMIAAATAAVLVIAFFPTIRGLIQIWAASSSFHHGFLVLPIAVWLCWRLGPAQTRAQIWPPAILAILAGLGLWLIGRAAVVNYVEQVAFVSIVIACVALIFGPAYLRRWAFPLLFLYFMVPVGDGFLPFLQNIAASSVASLLNVSGIHATIDGVMIATTTGRFQIAEACAGLNFLIAAMMLAAIFAHLAFNSARKIIFFTLFAGGFALAANILRAYLVILAASLSSGRISVVSDHVFLGWVFYGALIFLLIMVGARFADKTPRNDPPGEWTTPVSVGDAHSRGRLPSALAAALTLMLCGAVYQRLVIDNTPTSPAPSFLPLLNAPGWRALPPSTDWRAPLGHADRVVQAVYQSGSHLVEVNAAYFTHERRGAEIAGYDTRSYDGEDWRRVTSSSAPFFAFGKFRRLNVETLENTAGARLRTITLYWLGDKVFVSPVALKIREAGARLFGRQMPGGVIIIAEPANADHKDLRAIDAFLGDVEPFDAWLDRVDMRLPN